MPGSGFENAQSSCLSMISEQTLPFVEGKPVPTFPDHALFPAEHFNLPHPEHFYSWSTPRLDKAADTNPSIFEGLKAKAGGLERRHHAP
jgi:hypothetical protein